MSTDQADAPEYHLRFPAGRLEDSILHAIFLAQIMLGTIGMMAGGFFLLSSISLELGVLVIVAVPFVIAYLLTHLYEIEDDDVDVDVALE